MMIFLLPFLENFLGFHLPKVFLYTSTRMMLAALSSLLLTIFLGPPFIRKLYSMKIGQPIRKEECPLLGYLHRKKEETPTMGGVLILFTMIISLILWMDLTAIFTMILLVTTLSMGLLGLFDDLLKLRFHNSKGLSGKKKLLIQFLFSSFLAIYLLTPVGYAMTPAPPTVKEWTQKVSFKKNRATFKQAVVAKEDFYRRVYIPFYKKPLVILPTVGAFLFILFVVIGASNGVNLTDGLDGLAMGCLLMVSLCLGLFAFVANHTEMAHYLNIPYIEGSGEIAIYLSSLFGAGLGFLWFNGHPAQVFMGDTGSLSLGSIIGVAAVLLKRELLLGLVGGIFVVEALSVIGQVMSFKLCHGKRIFLCAPLHHHFEYKGWPETKVVIRFWILALILAIIGLASLKFQ